MFPHPKRTPRKVSAWLSKGLPGLAACLLFFALANGAAAQQGPDFNDPDAACYSADGATIVCAGDWSEGVYVDNLFQGTSYTRLELSADQTIEPAAGKEGIYILTHNNFTIETLEEDGFDILTTAGDASGIMIDIAGLAETAVFTVTHYGKITTTGDRSHGIFLDGEFMDAESGAADFRLIHDGDIETSGFDSSGIYVQIHTGVVDIIHFGDITATGDSSRGIIVNSENWNDAHIETITVKNFGMIEASSAGIDVDIADDVPIDVTQIGDIITNGQGIRIVADGGENRIAVTMTGNITINTDGNPVGERRGIDTQIVDSDVDGEETIENVVTYQGRLVNHSTEEYSNGIHAHTDFGSTKVSTLAVIVTKGWKGIKAQGSNVVTIEHIGTIAAAHMGIHLVHTGTTGTATVNLGRIGPDEDGQFVTGGFVDGDYISGVEIVAGEEGVYLDVADGMAAALNLYNDVTITGTTFDVRGDDSDDIITNHGTFTHAGIIDLGGGTNAFNNMQGAIYNSGSQLILGAGNVLTNHGELSPGGDDQIVTTALAGDFVQTATGSFSVWVDDVTGTSDLLEVDGSVTLDGLLVGHHHHEIGDDESYIILTYTGDLTGEFLIPLFNHFDADYSTEGQVIMRHREAPTYCEVAKTKNQRGVACNEQTDLTEADPMIRALNRLLTEDEARGVYDAVSGEAHPTTTGVLLQSAQINSDAVLQRLHQHARRFDDGAYGLSLPGSDDGLFGDGGGWWSQAHYRALDRDATTNTAQTDSETSGFLIGLHRTRDEVTLGIALGLSQGSIDVDELYSDFETETTTVGAYGAYVYGRSYLAGGLFAAWHQIDAERRIEYDIFHEHLESDYDAESLHMFAELGHDLHLDNTAGLQLHPFVGVSHTMINTDSFTENSVLASHDDSDSTVALTADEAENSLTTATLGIRAATEIDKINVNTMLAWRHASGDVEAETDFSLAGSETFTIAGSPVAENALIVEVGLQAQLGDGLAGLVSYGGQFSEDGQAHGINAKLAGSF